MWYDTDLFLAPLPCLVTSHSVSLTVAILCQAGNLVCSRIEFHRERNSAQGARVPGVWINKGGPLVSANALTPRQSWN